MLPLKLFMRDDVQLRPEKFLKLPYYQTIPRNLTHQVVFSSITSGLDFISNTTSESIPSHRDISPWTKHLIPGGCQISDSVDPITSTDNPGAPSNCSQACLDSSLLFGSLTTLANCITISSAALMIQNSNLPLSLPTNTTALATFGLDTTDLTNFAGSGILRDVIQCAVASCPAEGQGGNCSENELSALQPLSTPGFDNLYTVSAGLSHYCEGFVANIDSDVAGPGACSPLPFVFYPIIKAKELTVHTKDRSWSPTSPKATSPSSSSCSSNFSTPGRANTFFSTTSQKVVSESDPKHRNGKPHCCSPSPTPL